MDDYTVEFQKAPPDSFLEKVKRFFLAIWFLPRRFYNTYLLIKHQEFKGSVSKNVCPMRYLNPFLYLQYSAKIVTKTAVMKAVLKSPRKDPEGFFDDQDNAAVFLPLLRDLYPEEEISEEDFILTCNKENLRKYRQPLLKFMGPQSIEKQSQKLKEIIEDTIQYYSKASEINATEFSFVMTVTVISRLLLNHPGPFSTYLEITLALDAINQYSMKKTLHHPISKEEKEKYKESVLVIRTAINTALGSEEKGSFIHTLQEEKELTPLQIKLSLYVLYLAGSDTSASLMNYLLWQLGRHSEIQEEIFQEMKESKGDLFSYANNSALLHQVINESLRLFTPTYVIGRLPATPLYCTVKDKEGKVVFQEKIGKKEKLLCAPTFAARDPALYEEPDTFNPKRFAGPLKAYSWLPFADGAHSCPGQWLAKSELALSIALLVKKYRFESTPEKEFKQLGYLTLKPAEKVHLKLYPRNKE